MTEIRLPQLVDTIRATSGAYYKLTILAGGAQSGKTHWLKQVAIWGFFKNMFGIGIIGLPRSIIEFLKALTFFARRIRS